MVSFLQLLLSAVAMVVVPLSIVLWIRHVRRWQRGEPSLVAEPRRAVPWSLVDLLLVGLTGLVVVYVSQSWCVRQFDRAGGEVDLLNLSPRQHVIMVIAFSASSLFTWLVAMMICRWRAKATAADLGWDGSHWPHDVALGIGAFTMLIVPVLLIHYVLQRLLPTDETHPFVDLIMEDPRPEYLLPIAAAALLAAPLVEEYFFRVLLQGWLERLTASVEQSAKPPATAGDEAESWSPSSDAPLQQEARNPYAASFDQPTDLAANGDDRQDAGPFAAEYPIDSPPDAAPSPAQPGLPEQSGWRWLAIAISSLAFAVAHFGQGPAPIALFVLALGLGYLYQRTHRVLPGVVVHFLVNLTAVSQLALAVAEGQPGPLP